MTIKKILFAFLFAFCSSQIYSQNAFRVSVSTIITNNTLDEAYQECLNLFNIEPIISNTEDKKTTGLGFACMGGNITFGKNNLNGKIEGVIIYTRDNIETKWLNDITSSYFHDDNMGILINNFNRMPCEGFYGYGENPPFFLNIGEKTICMNIPIKL